MHNLFFVLLILYVTSTNSLWNNCKNELGLESNSKLFLVGDSMLFSMFLGLNCTHGWTFYPPKYSKKDIFSHLATFNYNNSVSYLIDSYSNATAVAAEVKGLHPTKNDIVIVLYGAHAYSKYMTDFYNFMKSIYEHLVKPFPGHAFWFEPFPQHFSTGQYISQDKEGPSCLPLSKHTNLTQFWRVEIYNKVVVETVRIHRVFSYNLMAPYWNGHHSIHSWSQIRDQNPDIANITLQANHRSNHTTGTLDCTHYTAEANSVALQALVHSIDLARKCSRFYLTSLIMLCQH